MKELRAIATSTKGWFGWWRLVDDKAVALTLELVGEDPGRQRPLADYFTTH